MDPNTVALALIQRWVGPDDKITDMSAFYDALVKALVDAHAEGEDEGEALVIWGMSAYNSHPRRRLPSILLIVLASLALPP